MKCYKKTGKGETAVLVITMLAKIIFFLDNDFSVIL
jgi:hypothetical protein